MSAQPDMHPEWVHNIPNPIPWARSQSQAADVVTFSAATPLDPSFCSPRILCPPEAGVPQPFSQPGIIHSSNSIPNSQIKRSSSSDDEEDDYEFQRPAKVFATADRVAAKLGHLNISSEGAVGQSVEIEELEEAEYLETEPVVHFSDEMRTVMSCESSDFMSDFMQHELDRSSKAVVLWAPNPMMPVVPIVETVDSDDSERDKESDECLSDDSDGVIIEEIVDDADVGDMEVEL